MRIAPLLLAGLCLGSVATVRSDDSTFLWIEGESAARSSLHRNVWFETIDPAELSEGAQIANFSELDEPDGWAEYDLTIPTSSTYHFWIRANPCTGLWYSFDQSPLSKLDAAALVEEDRVNRRNPRYVLRAQQTTNVAADGTHDARTMTWYYLETRRLSEGKHTLRFSLGGDEPGTKRYAAIDCFVLTRVAFKPQFQYKPGETPMSDPAIKVGESWVFKPARDRFSVAARLDLSQLNEKFAGEHGFIGLSKDGNSFVRGDGQPIRFWGGATYVQRIAREKKDQRLLIYHARFLAKRGVNLVRLHGAIEPKNEGSRVTDVDEEELDQMYRLVAGMKKAGIYTAISPFWPTHAHLQKSWGVADPGGNNCAGLLFFDPVLQRGYKEWLKRIYADANPYTGVPLAKDPAVAMIQIQNEDSLFFWSSQNIKGQALKNLSKLYGDWLLKKYGTLEQVRSAWQGCAHPDDDFSAGMPALFIVWELTQEARNQKGDKGGRAVRLADQAEFVSRLMFDFNQEIARYLREDLGCRQIINAGNWRTADQVVLDDAERFSYTANEVIGKNHYFAGLHNGINVGWQLKQGQVYKSKSFTTTPQFSPLFVRQVVGHPFIISEGLWVPPSRYQAEGPIIVAAQSCLTGLDLFLWFATGVEDWEVPGTKWTFAVPTTLGQFPAAALMFRNAYLREGPVVVHEERGLKDIWDRKLPLIAEMGAWDPNRDAGEMPLGTPFKAGVDPLAYLVGRVEVKYGGDPSRSTSIDLASYIDSEKKRIRSVTGEIESDLARGIYRINAPKAQGVVGMLSKAGLQELADVKIASSNDYASVTVVSLDDKPIASSGHLLVQIGTACWPTGWKEKPLRIPTPDGPAQASRITDVGDAPWQIEKMHGALGVKNASITKAAALDPNGMPIADIPIWKGNGEIRIKLPSNALYVCLESAAP